MQTRKLLFKVVKQVLQIHPWNKNYNLVLPYIPLVTKSVFSFLFSIQNKPLPPVIPRWTNKAWLILPCMYSLNYFFTSHFWNTQLTNKNCVMMLHMFKMLDSNKGNLVTDSFNGNSRNPVPLWDQNMGIRSKYEG